MKILFFTKGDKTVGSSRQRVWQLAKKLQDKYGIEHEVLHSLGYNLFSISFFKFKVLWKVSKKLFSGKYNLFFVHKSIFPLDIVNLIVLASRIKKVPVIYDIDDAEWVHSGLKTKLLAKNAKTIFCGSQVIKKKMEEFNKNVILLPTVVDSEIYKKYTIKHQEKDTINLGWVGYGPGYVKHNHLQVLIEALKNLKKEGFKFIFTFIGAKENKNVHNYLSVLGENVRIIDELEWSKEGVVAEALSKHGVDIGVAPIEDSNFSLAKCAFKIIEYIASGLPVVVSPVGEQAIVARDGTDGFHAKGLRDWVSSIKGLKNLNLRKKMGRSGQERVEEKYSYKAILPLVYREIQNVTRKSQS